MKIWVPVINFKKIELGGAKHAPVFIEGTSVNHHPPKKRKSKLIAIIIAVVLVFGGLIWLSIRGLNTPAEGSIDNSEVITPKVQSGAGGKYEDNYFSIKYPSSYRVIPNQETSPYLSSVSLLSSRHPTTHVAINLVPELLSNDPGVSFRQSHSELYKPVATNDLSLVFSRPDQDAEYTGFIAHNGMVISISLTSVGSSQLKGDYDFLANSLSWKQ